jgi:Tol biopolymer transport system component
MVRRLTSDGPAQADASVGTAQLSNDGRRIAATVHTFAGGTGATPGAVAERAELRIFDVDGRGPGRTLVSWPVEQLIRFSVRPFGWSPRDDRIWLMAWFRDQHAEIISVDLTGQRRILKTLPFRDHSQPPSLSPDGRFITYHDAVNRQTPPDIVVIASDGTREQRLEHPANDNKPIFMPDGSGIVFESDRRGTRDLWFQPLVDGQPSGPARMAWRDIGPHGQAEGFATNGSYSYYFASNDWATYTLPVNVGGNAGAIGERVRLAPMLNEMNTSPAFSPDGRTLVVFRARGRRIVIRDVASGREREIPLGAELGLYPTADWCADGRRVIVTGYVTYNGNVALEVDTAESTIRRLPLTEPAGAVCTAAGEVVYVRVTADSAVVRRSLASGAETVLFTGAVRSLARSADGSQIAFIARDAGGSRLLTLPIAGTETPRELLKAGYLDGSIPLLQNVAWMPDGKRLLLIRYDDEFAGAKEQIQRPLWLWEVAVDGSNPRRIGQLPMSPFSGYFAGVTALSVHPDGRQIAYQAHEGYIEQTWSIDNLAQFIRANAGS